MQIHFARALRGLALASSLSALGACAEPLQNGGVLVFSGASARFDAMCRFRRGADGGTSSCVPASPDVPRATVGRISEATKLPKGLNAESVVGDVLLTNGEVSLFFGGQTSSTPGVLLDVIDAHVGQDELDSMATCVAAEAGCLPLAAPQFGQERDGSAWVEVQIAGQNSFDARTRYTLLPGARAVLVSTIVSTQSNDALSLSRVGDIVAWGSSQPVVPSSETLPFVAGVGTEVAYAIVAADERSSVAVDATENAMLVRHARDVSVRVGQPWRRDRVLVVAPRGDTLGVLTEIALLRDGQGPGAIEVKFVGADGAALPPPAGGRVRLLSPSFSIPGYLTTGQGLEGPTVAAEAPAGKYAIDFEGKGHHAAARVPVEVRPGEVTPVVLTIVANVVEPAP